MVGGSMGQGRGSGRRVAVLCLVAALLGLVAGRPARLGTAYAALSVELEDRLRTREPAGELRLHLGPDGRDIRLAGEIGEGAAGRLERLLAASPQVVRIHLTSEGGLVDEASAIGDLIAARHLATYVPDYCVSACTLAFARGQDRFLVTGGRLGFHAPYEQGLFGQVFQADAAAERAAYVAAGIEPGFVDEALSVASADIWVPEAPRLVRARFVTEIVETDRFPDSTLDDDASPAAARAAILRALPLLEGFARTPVLERLAARYRDGYRAGRSEAEAVDRLRREAERAIGRALAGADDATVVAVGAYLQRAMRAGDAETCRRIGGEGNLLLAQEALDEPREARTLLARAVGQGAGQGAGAGQAAPAEVRDRRPATRSPGLPHDCPGLIEAYARALARPEPAPGLRALILRKARPAHEALARP